MQHPLLHFRNAATLPARSSFVALLLTSTLAFPAAAHAATLCVDQHGKAGCYTTISAAVTAAASGDTVKVNPGIYHEAVILKQPISLLGVDRDSTVIDANGLSNGIYINGFDNPALGFGDLDQVTVTGFTIRNANFEGILVNNVSHATVWGNRILDNDEALQGTTCVGLPAFETGESADCGGGIHLIGVVHSTISDNVLQGNAAGIELTDETTTTHDNVVSRNLALNNKNGAGFALSSYLAYIPPDLPRAGVQTFGNGLYNNLIIHNQSIHNGGAGVLIVAPLGGTRAYANQVANNRITGNTGAGIEIHAGLSTTSGTKNGDASRNTLFGNFISQNGADAYAGTTVPTGISVAGQANIIDSLLTSNVIEKESVGVAFNSASTLELHLNDLIVGRNVGVANLNAAGIVNASENWWGCPNGPGTPACSTATGTVNSTPSLTWPYDATGGHGHDLFFNSLPSYLPILAFDLQRLGFNF